MSEANAQIAADIVNAWAMNDRNDPHEGDALRGRIEAALDKKERDLHIQSKADLKEVSTPSGNISRNSINARSSSLTTSSGCGRALCLSWPETRPWLKKHLRTFLTLRDDLLRVAETIIEKYGEETR